MLYPKVVTIDNHRSCNARCRMCPTQNVPFDTGLMQDHVFSSLLEQVRSFSDKIKFVHFGVHGEPLLDKKLEARVASIRKLGVNVWIATNGAAMTYRRAKRFLEAGTTSVIFSIDGATKTTYESIRIGLDYERVVENAKRFVSLRNSLNASTKVVLRFIEQDCNRVEYEKWQAFWATIIDFERGDSFHKREMHNWAIPLNGIDDFGMTPCPDLTESILISSDGSVPLCCFDYGGSYSFGNIAQTHLLEIYNSPSRMSARKLHESGRRKEMELCKSCYQPEFVNKARTVDIYYRAIIEQNVHWNEQSMSK